MSRPHYIFGSDGMPQPDDLIPRCPANGNKAVWNEPIRLTSAKLHWPKPFADRLDDAKRRLKAGEPVSDVRSRHGIIVVRQAQLESIKT